MLDMYGIIIFSFFFSFWLGNGRLKTYGVGIHTFVLLPHDFFEFRTNKKVQPQSLLPMKVWCGSKTALSYSELQPPIVNALKGLLVKDAGMG